MSGDEAVRGRGPDDGDRASREGDPPRRSRPPRTLRPRPVAGPDRPGRTSSSTAAAPGRPAGTQVVEVRFKGLRSDFFAFSHPVPLTPREYVVVEADRGQDIGIVHRAASAADLACEGGCDAVGERSVPLPAKRVIRRASPADVGRLLELRAQEMEVRRRTRELVTRHQLRMKVSEAEWQWDRNKLTVYFTAEKRVDFRALVRDMARTFRTRIELRQIGVSAGWVAAGASSAAVRGSPRSSP